MACFTFLYRNMRRCSRRILLFSSKEDESHSGSFYFLYIVKTSRVVARFTFLYRKARNVKIRFTI